MPKLLKGIAEACADIAKECLPGGFGLVPVAAALGLYGACGIAEQQTKQDVGRAVDEMAVFGESVDCYEVKAEFKRKLRALGFTISELYNERGDFGVVVDIMNDVRGNAVEVGVVVVDLSDEDVDSEALLSRGIRCERQK